MRRALLATALACGLALTAHGQQIPWGFLGSTGAAPPFSPSDITGLIRWYDAAPAYLFTDSACTTPVASDGDAVGCWQDRSATADPAVQATAGNQPTYRTNVLNSLPVVRFVRARPDKLLSSANVGLTGDVVATMFVVVKYTDSSDDTAAGWGTQGVRQMFLSYNLGFSFYADSIAGGTLNQYQVLTLLKSAGAINATAKYYVNGTLNTGGSANAPSVANSPFKIGGMVSPDRGLSGDVAHILLYNSALSDTNRGKVQTFLCSRYGVTCSLIFVLPFRSRRWAEAARTARKAA